MEREGGDGVDVRWELEVCERTGQREPLRGFELRCSPVAIFVVSTGEVV